MEQVVCAVGGRRSRAPASNQARCPAANPVPEATASAVLTAAVGRGAPGGTDAAGSTPCRHGQTDGVSHPRMGAVGHLNGDRAVHCCSHGAADHPGAVYRWPTNSLGTCASGSTAVAVLPTRPRRGMARAAMRVRRCCRPGAPSTSGTRPILATGPTSDPTGPTSGCDPGARRTCPRDLDGGRPRRPARRATPFRGRAPAVVLGRRCQQLALRPPASPRRRGLPPCSRWFFSSASEWPGSRSSRELPGQ